MTAYSVAVQRWGLLRARQADVAAAMCPEHRAQFEAICGTLGEEGDRLLAESKELDEQQAELAPASLVPFTEITAKAIRWAWRDRIALGKITALAGKPKIGKGLLYSDLIALVTRGDLEGELEDPGNAIVVTTEDDPGDTLKPRLMAANADLGRVFMFQMGSREDPVPFRVPQDAETLGRLVAEKNAALVVVDPLMEFIDGKVDSHKSHPVRQAIASLNAIAREASCAILVIFHLNKGTSTDPLLRHEASAAFLQVVRASMLIGHDPDDPAGERGNRRVLATTSSNLAALAPSLVYEIAAETVTGDNGDRINTAAIRCVGESEATGQDLLKAQHEDGREPSALDEAQAFLLAELASGPRPAKEVTAAARSLGIAPATLRRAKSELEIKSVKPGQRDPWEWALPQGAQAAMSALGSQADEHLGKSPVNTGDSADPGPQGAHSMEGEHVGPKPAPQGEFMEGS